MENKYYTPTIDEFHVGFEYEFEYETMIFTPDGKGTKIKNWSPAWFNLAVIPTFDTNIRVKYLDKEDIESLGWIKTWEEVKSYGIYFKGKLGNYEIWYAKGTDKDVCYVNITNKQHNGNCRVYIKNKSELKRLMKQLGINEETNK